MEDGSFHPLAWPATDMRLTLYPSGKLDMMRRFARWITPLKWRKRLPIDVQAWLFGEIIISVRGSAMLMDNIGLTVTVDDRPEPPEGA